jgi:hypothetical protein
MLYFKFIQMKQLVVILFLIPLKVCSQELVFCEDVNRSGIPQNPSKEFTIGSDGGRIKVLVKQKKEVGSTSIVFDVYRKISGKESFDNSVRMEIQPGVTWFYKEITFYKPGEYIVYVYDEQDKLLGLGALKINLK